MLDKNNKDRDDGADEGKVSGLKQHQKQNNFNYLFNQTK